MKSNHHNTPAILHTSHEARLVGLEHYILSFGSKVTGRIGDGTTEIAIPAPISYDKGWDILCPMENLDVFDNIQESPLYTGDHFMKDLLKEAEADKKKFKTIAFDAGKSFSIMWAAQFATFAGCKEIVAYCCPETLIRRYGSATPLNLDYISLNEDMDQKLAAADIDAVFKEIFVYIGEHFEKYKGWRRTAPAIQKHGALPEGWDPVVEFMLFVERKD